MLCLKFHTLSKLLPKGLGKISEKAFVELLKAKDDIVEEDIQEMLDEYYRLAKLKGITTEKPDPPSDSEDDDDNIIKKPPPPPPVKSPPGSMITVVEF